MTRRQKIKLIESIQPRMARSEPKSGKRKPQNSGRPSFAALNEVKGLGAAGVPSLRQDGNNRLYAAATRGNDRH